jgi:hypothetical protein
MKEPCLGRRIFLFLIWSTTSWIPYQYRVGYPQSFESIGRFHRKPKVSTKIPTRNKRQFARMQNWTRVISSAALMIFYLFIFSGH